MKDTILNQDTANRARTNADRRAFVIAETAAAAAAEIVAHGAAPEAPAPTGAFLAPGRQSTAARARRNLREESRLVRTAAFVRALGEAVYASIPMDEIEKAAYHGLVVEQTAELLASCGADERPHDLSRAGLALAEMTDELVDSLPADRTPASAAAAVSAAVVDPSSPLGAAIRESAAEVEERVLAAVLDSQQRAAAVEGALAEAASHDDGDPELAELRRRKAAGSQQRTLIETLYAENRRGLSESAGAEVPADVVLAEAVAQYALLETLSSFGAVRFGDPAELVRRLRAVRLSA